ncbi:MAG: MMPL family transporter [Pseudolabrys sp.]|nr:MMPL family transporter [Pseudolabrys sp.]
MLMAASTDGFMRLQVDDSLSQLFRSNTEDFRTYQEVSRRFPSSEFDVVVVIEGNTLLTRPALEKLRNVAVDLQLIDGTRGIISMFSAREPPTAGQIPPPLFPNPLPEGGDYRKLIDRVVSNEIIKDKLLSPDGKLTLMVLALDPAATAPDRLSKVIGEVRQTVDDDLADSDLKGELSGVPVMQLEIRNAIERDRLVYNSLGFALGCLIATVFFRRLSFVIIAATPPLIAILLGLGTLGWFGFKLNMFLNVMTPLIMVISFSDSMQLTFAARDRLLLGDDKRTAFRNALFMVGPACVLTHATAGISFIALQVSQSETVRAFGEAGLIVTLTALPTVLLAVPLLGLLLIGNETKFVDRVRGMDKALDLLRRLCGWIAAHMVDRPALYSFISLVVVGLLTLGYLQLEPRYRLADQVPDHERAVSASHQLDEKLAGANPLDVYIRFPQGISLFDPQTLDLIAGVHEVLEKQHGIGNVWSLETLRQWLARQPGGANIARLQQYLDLLPRYLTRRFISEEQNAVIVSGRVPDADASRLLPIVNEVDGKLEALRKRYPDFQIEVTGLSVIAARNNTLMIDKLSNSLTVEIAFVAVFIAIAFRSPVVMLITVLPGLFPIVFAGTLLWLMGQGLQFASIIALMVSFGLGLSATIHFLNRLQIEDIDPDPAIGVRRATVFVGPPLILTSAVLVCGLAMTVLSSLPSLRLFGWLSAFAMASALIADLFMLRPIATFLTDLFARRRRSQV